MIMFHYYYWFIIVHGKIIVLIGIWRTTREKQCYHKGVMGHRWLTN
jgi:hypothetical protein